LTELDLTQCEQYISYSSKNSTALDVKIGPAATCSKPAVVV